MGGDALRKIEDEIGHRPLLTLAIAAGIGFLAGMAGRRHRRARSCDSSTSDGGPQRRGRQAQRNAIAYCDLAVGAIGAAHHGDRRRRCWR